MDLYHQPFLLVKYKYKSYIFYNQVAYNNWLKTITDPENISDTIYHEGLGMQKIQKPG